ncbi:CASP-like protein 1D1 [Morus notabilis]|uniref:CASP-like protein 1D1 n=1 Tax=Morus notabilis TaxID=981085 RepID=UPI000CED1FCC|nr:CASP-like protein 1D1 [Morus notabilis]
MASSSDKPEPEPEIQTYTRSTTSSRPANCFGCDLFLRILLIGASVTCVVVMIFGKQTKEFYSTYEDFDGPVYASSSAEFTNSPAYIYFIVALSVAVVYSIVTALASFAALLKSSLSTIFLVVFAFLDPLMLGVVVSAAATLGAVAYIELKGNEDLGWRKVCHVYTKYCKHVGSSFGVSLFASFLLVFLIWISASTLYRRVPKTRL